jgi:ribosomal protein S27E
VSEVTAGKEYHCPSCGAEAHWNPAKKALVCGYCGTVAPLPEGSESPTSGVEHDLLQALQSIGDDQRGWEGQRISVRCQSCQAITVFEPSRAAQRCDFCGSAAIIPIEQQMRPIRPEALLEFKLPETGIREAIRKWYGSRWFAPNNLGTKALTDTVKGIYVPYWTFDAHVSADWSAMSGDYYYETEYYTDSDGKRQSRQVQKIRWYPSSGHVDHFFDDELVPATRGVRIELLRRVEPFPSTTELKPYSTGYLSGWTVEQYQIDLFAAAKAARDQMDNKTRQLCAQQVPGDTHRDLQVDATYSNQTFKHILVPVWLLAYTYRTETYQVVVNGYTGTIAGQYPKSWGKITLLILVILALIGLIAWGVSKSQRTHPTPSTLPSNSSYQPLPHADYDRR